jgi:transcriptional regulator with XRE-family HTH domain
MNVRELGEYIRGQRNGARLSLRKMAGLSGVSIPYLSQIERGLRKPSADVLQGIAKGLRISAEQLYVKAGMLDEHPTPDVASAIMGDPTISERQKQALLQIYEAFREETGRARPPAEPERVGRPARSTARTRTTNETSAPRAGTGAAKRSPKGSSAARNGGRAGAQAVPSPHPARPRPPAPTPRKEV